MVVSSLRQVGLSYTSANSRDGRKTGQKREERRCHAATSIAEDFSDRAPRRSWAQPVQRARRRRKRRRRRGAGAAALKPTARVADFVAGFDLKGVPALAIERARLAFIDSVGVTLAGSRSEPAAIVLELVRAEGAAPAASIVGQSLRSSPQLAAPANGGASHALGFD